MSYEKLDIEKYKDRTILHATLSDNAVTLELEDRITLSIQDSGQECCEERYLTCDDNLWDLVDGKLMDISLRDGGTKNEGTHETHETLFLDIRTDQTSVTICSHNEHNGWYGGIAPYIKETRTRR